MCQHCGCRNTGFDYTQNFNADNSSKPKMTLTCHTNPAGQTQVKAEFEDGRVQYADYNWWTGSRYKDRYDIIDNTTEDCGGKGSGDVAPPKEENGNGNGNGNENGGTPGDAGPAPGTEESETDMGMVGFAIAGGAILIAAFLFGRR